MRGPVGHRAGGSGALAATSQGCAVTGIRRYPEQLKRKPNSAGAPGRGGAAIAITTCGQLVDGLDKED
jgi:hypothetical protein